MNTEEHWMPVRDFEKYYVVSSHGRLRRIATHNGRAKDAPIKPHEKKDGYFDFWLWTNGKPTRRKAHRVVWEAFNGPIPSGMVINHKNGVKDDNRLQNLEVVTPGENTAHGFRVLGRAAPNNPSFGVNNGSAKLNPEKVQEIRHRLAKGEYQYLIAADYGVSQRLISLIGQRRIWAEVD